ncbi:dTDP-4-dehydrorhamnose 3,5-epimerase [Devosia faecipullorum]|uniref:dTDP-4-dehydrorhamnose 3,5-epimerase n=1 Tax=Devosia faecipullorum TaxID=2755039 RepID=UPI00187B9E60|nr:dTDP-4-dehydrorhamnose 3,5-epimerase [Devosia faecipullorum]MBE7731954.1 dTDP-4-dehydrorhamnose 3,5-epimerase [Devosia faecipullorum]
MIFHETTLKDAWLIELQPRGDDRGMFARTFCRDEFAAHGMETNYVQQNMSVSAFKGTLRGMHFQRQPHAEVKVIRCVRGAILDVIVDMRSDSPSYLKHEGFELNAQNRRQLYVPRGFAHGFMTLSDDVEVTYLVSAPYTPTAEGGLRYDDPKLAISWPLDVTTISDKDAAWPFLTETPPAI